jgi:hypothetical protein
MPFDDSSGPVNSSVRLLARWCIIRFGDAMTKKKLTLSYLLLIALVIFGAWLTGQFIDYLESVPDLRILPGLIIPMGAVVGILLLIRDNRKPMNQGQRLNWASIRNQGKKKYIRGYVLIGLLVGLSNAVFSLIKDYWSGRPFDFSFNNLVFILALSAISIGGLFYAAIRMWDYNEWKYKNAPDPKPQPNNSFNRSAG